MARLGIARTFQNIELFTHMSTMENMMVGRHIVHEDRSFPRRLHVGEAFFRGQGRGNHRRKVEEIIDLLDLQAVRNKFVGGLPYGTQKQVELGRALALEPELLLLDEPAPA